MASGIDALIDQALGSSGGTVKFSAPEIIWNAQGEAGYWREPFHAGGQPVFVRQPQFDDPRKAVNYQAPKAAPAPRYPTTEITPTGDIFRIDPYTGTPSYVGNDPRLATGFSPSQQRANDVFDRKQDESFQLDVLGRQQAYGTSERLGSEAFTSSQNALDRAIQAANLAAGINLQNQQNAFSADQAYQQAMRQYSQDRLGAAQQVANNISAVDPGALPAFYEAGGGVIANALANGATARTDMSDFGSARALRTAEEMLLPERFNFTPVQFDPSAWMGLFAPPPQVQPQAAAPRTHPVGQASPLGVPSGQAAAQGHAKSKAEAAQGVATAFDAKGDTWEMVNGQWVQRFATGTGDIPAPKQFISGDSMGADPAAGGARPELVTVDDPTGDARLSVDPLVPPEGAPEEGRMSSFLRAVADFIGGEEPFSGLPRFATGTNPFNGVDPIQITDADRPYLDRVGAVRDNVEFPNLNPFDVRFALNAPSQIARFYQGRQTKYAVPVEDQAAETNRFTLGGVGRGSLALGF